MRLFRKKMMFGIERANELIKGKYGLQYITTHLYHSRDTIA